MAINLVWLRNDLRMTDNLALHAACQDPNAKVLALFIATPQQWASHEMAPRQAAFLRDNLQLLTKRLNECGIIFYYHQCDDFKGSVNWLINFCQKMDINALYYNYQYELRERQRDQDVEQQLAGKVACHGFHDTVLLAPGEIVTANGEMYKVYTPFRRAFMRRLLLSEIACVPAPQRRNSSTDITSVALLPFDYPQVDYDNTLFPPGEAAGLKRLRYFCREQVQNYSQWRDTPSMAGTSQLSPYLALGVISPRQCLHRLHAEHHSIFEQAESGAGVWLNELIWREFYRHLLVAYPRLCCYRPFIDWTDHVRWNYSPELLISWQQGRTGYPIVDAAMRQMNTIGWMHNRLRMISASFLVKDLLIDWRLGERYFMSQLLDGDLAANNGGWQWAAATGTDAAPYFRIFNPTIQGERFDPQGEFIRRWVPELHKVPISAIHQPWIWAKKQQCHLDYPMPIVDHQKARLATLAAFTAAKEHK